MTTGSPVDLSGLIGDIGPPGSSPAAGWPSAAALADPAARAAPAGRCGRIGAPIARPGKVVCIGLNYRDHAAETGAAIPERPVVFMKDPSTVIGPYDDVRIPRGSERDRLGGRTRRRHRRHRPLPRTRPRTRWPASPGYAVSHDVSERAFQLDLSPQWDLGKSCETFNPLGPWLVTADEVPDPQALGLRLTVNGRKRQDGSTGNMIFGVAYLIWYLSQYMVLEPGDLINTGTPAGVALGLPDHPYLRAGDEVRLEIDGLGWAQQRFIPPPDPPAGGRARSHRREGDMTWQN